jgi:hypothetical protein
LFLFLLVTFFIPVYFLCPEFRIGLGQTEILAPIVPMPETAIYKDTGPVLAQYDVRMPRQTGIVHPIAESPAPQKPPYHHLGLGILSLDGSHRTMHLR